MNSKIDLFEEFHNYSVKDLEKLLVASNSREEKAFYRTLLNFRLQMDQEKIVGEVLL